MQPTPEVAVLAEGFNPFDLAHPTFGPFTELLGPKVGLFLGVVWAGGFCVVAFYLVEGIVRMAKAKRAGYADAYDEAKSGLGWPVVSTMGLSILPLIFSALAK